MSVPARNETLLRTPLHALHVELGARLVPFAGYDMPLQYKRGILQEHLHTRAAAGLFDVSHMGQLIIRPRSGVLSDATLALESLVPVDVAGLAEGRQRYALFTSESGGILDDLMIANRGDHYFLVVNGACKSADMAHLHSHLAASCAVEMLPERALLAVQGPAAESVLAPMAPELAFMRFMDVRSVIIAGIPCEVLRSGYTGEDGFEISVSAAQAEILARIILKNPAAMPVGLGARDSLRLEAGLCLYGSDLDQTTTPVEAALEWAIQKVRRPGGARAGGYPGADIVGHQLETGASRRRVGLRPDGRAPVRAGTKLFVNTDATMPAGIVTSGVFGPSAGVPVAMGYVDIASAKSGTVLYAELRGNRIATSVCNLPFVPSRFKRK
jgi:aminomethyltransferase